MEPVEVYITRYKNKILNVLIIIVTLFTTYNIYKDQVKAIQILKASKQKETEKNEILDTISKMDKKIMDYKNFINKKDMSTIIDDLGNIADNSNTKILSIKPELEQPYPLYLKYTFNLVVRVNNYHILGKFISKLEKSDNVYMVEGLGISADYASSKEGDIKVLTINMKISTYLIKD